MNIIELAKEAGMLSINDKGLYGDFVNLERFAAFVRAEALEEAARICESKQWNNEFECAKAIRELK